MRRGPLRALGGVAVLAAPAAGFAALAARRLLRDLDAVVVDGRSMAPTLEPGDRLVVESRTFRHRSPRLGEIVLTVDPRAPHRELVKRVAALSDGEVMVLGDGPASTDSRTFGPIASASVRWRAAFRYWPPRRLGRVR